MQAGMRPMEWPGALALAVSMSLGAGHNDADGRDFNKCTLTAHDGRDVLTMSWTSPLELARPSRSCRRQVGGSRSAIPLREIARPFPLSMNGHHDRRDTPVLQ